MTSLWRVQVLPCATIDYHGQARDFTRAYLTEILVSFTDGVFETVPFMLGDTHTYDPSRFGGEVKVVEVVEDGLDVIVSANAAGELAIRSTPDLAAAPRLIEHYPMMFGTVAPVVMQHVLGTTKPLIPGLRGWEEVEAA